MLGILCGHWRYAHINAICGHGINPGLLGMKGVVSEDVVRLGIGLALSWEELGQRLGISEETVKSPIKAIFQKLGATDRAEAIARAFELGLLGAER